MATFEKRGTKWRARVRRKGEADKAETFATKGQAQAWAERTERQVYERRARGTTDADDKTFSEIITWYLEEEGKLTKWGATKTADLKRIKTYDIAERVASGLKQRDFVRFAEDRRKTVAASTTLSDLLWMKVVLKTAKGSLGLSGASEEIETALQNLQSRRIVGQSRRRDRRPTQEEIEKLCEHFRSRDSYGIPMADIIEFALLTARRQEEITRIKWCDVDPVKGIGRLDDVKHPRQKIGNRRAFRLVKAALELMEAQPTAKNKEGFVFPYNPRSVSSAFTRAVQLLGIEDLRFHDLRHHAISLLFEKGYSIQEVAMWSLHDSWSTLRRYTHLKPEDVKER